MTNAAFPDALLAWDGAHGPGPSASICQCFACRHPSAENADERTLHSERHAGFVDWLADHSPVTGVRLLSRYRRLEVTAQEMDPECAPIRYGHDPEAAPIRYGPCRWPEHVSMPAHGAAH